MVAGAAVAVETGKVAGPRRRNLRNRPRKIQGSVADAPRCCCCRPRFRCCAGVASEDEGEIAAAAAVVVVGAEKLGPEAGGSAGRAPGGATPRRSRTC